MFVGVGRSLGASPTARLLVAMAAVVVLVGDGILLSSYAGTASSSPPVLVPAPPTSSPTSAAPQAPPSPVDPVPGDTEHRPATRPGNRWPTDLPDPNDSQQYQRGPSPFARRCADGSIPAQWCHGFPS